MGSTAADAGITLRPGRLYVMTGEERLPMVSVASALFLAAAPDFDKVWVTESHDSGRIGGDPDWRRLAAESKARFFIRSAESRAPALKLLEDLDYFGVKAPSLVVIEGAGPLVAADVLPVLRRWAEGRGCALLLLCLGDDRHDPLATIWPEADHLAGFVRLRRNGERISWEIFHWFGNDRFIANRRYRFNPEGTLTREEQGPPEGAVAAPDEDRVVAMSEALIGCETRPSRWRVVEEWEAIAEVGASLKAATVILPFGRSTSLERLARLVFDLRRSSGPQLKIVVREVNPRLRHTQEQLLRRLGANLVIPAEVGFSRLLSLVESVQGQLFTHPLPADCDAALAEAAPPRGSGYLAPAPFAAAVTEAVRRARPLAIHHALVCLSLPTGLGAVEALSHCAIDRPGDLCTADEKHLYLFLFGCRGNDIGVTLERLFHIPVGELFDGELRLLSPESIARRADEIARRAPGLRDLSEELTAWGGPQRDRAAPVVTQAERRQPPRAVRRPLAISNYEEVA